jgi:hypothetical protein
VSRLMIAAAAHGEVAGALADAVAQGFLAPPEVEGEDNDPGEA